MVQTSWPNRITITRIILLLPFVMILLHMQDPDWGETARYWALGLFSFMAISDFLDGFLARRLNQITTLGRILDPCADLVLVTSSIVLLARDKTCVPGCQIPAVVAVLIVGKEILQIVGFLIVYAETGKVHVMPERLGKWCMATLMVMIAAVLASPDLPTMVRYGPNVLWWIASGLAVASFVQYFQRAKRFIVENPPLSESPEPAVEPHNREPAQQTDR